MKTNYKAQADARVIANQLAAMPKGDDINDFGPAILAVMHDVKFNVWVILDEKPGLFDYMDDRFYMLRQVRNHPVYGKKLFAALKK